MFTIASAPTHLHAQGQCPSSPEKILYIILQITTINFFSCSILNNQFKVSRYINYIIQNQEFR